MKAVNFFYLDEEQQWLGYLRDHPDYWKEAASFEQLRSNLSYLDFDLTLIKALNDGKAA